MASKPRQPHVKLNAEVYLKLSAVRDQIDPDKIPESMGLATIISGQVVALAGETRKKIYQVAVHLTGEQVGLERGSWAWRDG